MKILILGGTGAMGVDLVQLLATRNNEVIVTSRSSHKSEYNNVRYVQCNAHEDAALMNLVEKEGNIDAVVDFMVYYHIDQLKSRLIYLLKIQCCDHVKPCKATALFPVLPVAVLFHCKLCTVLSQSNWNSQTL